MPGLRERIDTNKNNRIDISAQCNEINNFILDKKFGEQNLNELGKHLNNLGWNDNLGIKDALGSYFTTPEWRSLNQGIKNKVSNNEPLSKKELSLLYLEMISGCGGAFGQMQMIPGDIKFDSRQSIDKMCNGKLIAYIRSKFQNPLYIGKKPKKIDLPTTTQKKKKVTINPDRMNEAQTIGGSVNLPENIGEIKEEYLDLECKRLIQRAKDNYGNETNKITRDGMSKYGQKTESEKKAYINYNVLLFAFEKYSEAVIREQEKLIIKSGYTNSAEFENQVKLMEEFGNEIKNKYPGIDKILEKIKKFEDEIRQNEKKYFKNEQETKKAEQNFKEFNKYIETKSREYKISEIQDSLNKDPQNGEEAKKYLQNINILLAFQDDISEKNKMYGDNISKYQNYLRGALSIEKKYNIQQYEDILKKYSQDISKWNKKIDFKKYNNYREGLDRKLEAGLKNINKLQGIITNPQHKYFPFEEIRDAEIQKRIKQESIDKIWNKIKELSPVLYYKITAIAGGRNGFIDATVGAIGSLEIMLMSTIINIRYGIDNAGLYFTDTGDKINNLFKIPISSGINAPIYDPQTGKINLNFDNTIYTTQNALSQMLILIYGGGAMGKGITKAFSIGESVAGRAGLFSMSFISQVGGIYQEAITNGLTGGEALGYSMLAASVQSGLELVSPNEVLLGKGSGIAKELIKNACKSGSKESLILLGKTFTKNVGIEIVEENFQESLQLMTGNLINMAANGTLGGELGVDWKRQNFASTAIITTLTTGIATGTSGGLQMRNLSQQSKNEIIRQIKNDNGLYNDVMKIIEKGINGELKIPSVNIQQLQELKNQLNLGPSSETTPIIEEPNADYFNGKSHKFDVTEVQARGNSEMMDNVLKEINEQNKSEKLSELRKVIIEQYKQATGEEINLTDEQLLSILDAHEQDGKLGELTLGQLRQKVKVLDETITDQKVRRFLLEAGFCGMRKFLGVETEQDIELEDPLNNQIDIPYSDKYSLGDDIIIFDADAGTPVIAKIMKYTYETREYTIEWIDNNGATHTGLITEDQIDSDENEVRNSIDYDDIYHRGEQVYIEDNGRKIVGTITSCYDSNFLIERTEGGIKRKKICTKSYLDECNGRDVTIANSGGNYDNVGVVTPEDDSDVVMVSSGGNYDNAGYVTNVSDNVDSSDVELYSPEEIRRVANIYGEYINFDVDKYVENYANIPLYGKKEEYIRAVLSFIKDNMKNTQNVDNFGFFRITANVIDYILSNSNITLENIKNIMQDERINVEDIKYAVKQNNKISNETELKQEIKKYNILLNIENEEDLQKFIIGKKVGSNITGNISQYIRENELSQPEEQVKDRYYGNFDQETGKYTMARDIGTSEYDMQLIQNIINQQDIKPRGLESNSVYDLLKKLHDSDIETFVMYSKYLLGEDVTSLAGEYSVGSGGGHELDPALYRHTAIGEEGPISDRKYRIIGEFSTGEIVRSGEINQLEDGTANLGELERITLGEVSNNNISQIIDLETGKVVYDRNTGYVDQSIKNISTNGTNTEDADIVEDDSDVVMINPEDADIVEDDSDVVMVNPESRGINMERREMSEVHRNSDVVAIGDLHGQYEALKGNMEYAGLVREVNGHLEWIGGNKKVVFQGDILADRGTDGFKIIKEIHWLREQARKQGGDISIIAGNHDDFMISYLTGRNGSHGHGYEPAGRKNQGLGLTELAKFIGESVGDFDALLGDNTRQQILQAMRNSPEGRLILEEICNMKLVSQVDDVLYCHTNPTEGMLQYLTSGRNIQENINLLNQKYQGFLKKVLLGEGNLSITIEEFNYISDIFLSTGNRDIGLNNQYADILRNNGINMISHGHSGGDKYRSTEIGGVKVVDTDYSYGKGGNINDEREHSISIIKKEGGVNYLGDNVIYASLDYPIGTEVYVKRSAGGESKARVESYNPTTKKYRVTWNEGGRIAYKDVTVESLSMAA